MRQTVRVGRRRLAIIRAGGSNYPLLQATPDMGRTRWILIPCAWTIIGLLFTVQQIAVAKVHGGHVSWVLVGVIELVYWNVWAAYTPLVIALAKRFPLTGPRFVSHIAIHTIASLLMAPLASVTDYQVFLLSRVREAWNETRDNATAVAVGL